MGNHVHMLVRVGPEDVGQIIRRIATGYAGWFNGKYERVGHLFQDRLRSEHVESDGYSS